MKFSFCSCQRSFSSIAVNFIKGENQWRPMETTVHVFSSLFPILERDMECLHNKVQHKNK